ncbi:MAG: CBS domain-containing protein [Halapricum sp.]
MTVRDYMTEGVETAGPDATVEAIAMRLEQAGVGSIIIEEEMEPVGIVTDRDLAIRVDARDRPASEVAVADVMTADPVTVSADADLFAAARTMRDNAVRRLIVVNEEGKLVGIITFDDLMRLFVTGMADLTDVIDAESPTY